jgi:phage repressor protein C with HTH and peptisase S24 domain
MPSSKAQGDLPLSWARVDFCPPGGERVPAGVLLYEEKPPRLRFRFRRDWEDFADPNDAWILQALEDDLNRKAEIDATATLQRIEDSWSHLLQLSDRQPVAADTFDRTLLRLYRETVPVPVRQFVTHLPYYPLEAAAGPFRTQSSLDPGQVSDWIEVPRGLSAKEGYFVAEVHGDSMEPEIPNGSLCVFRHGVAGSRHGRMILVEARDQIHEAGGRYTVKIFRREKLPVQAEQSEYDEGGRTHVWLESINPRYAPIVLDGNEDNYALIAEFIQVLG